MLKKLLSKIKNFVRMCVLFCKGKIYSPYVKAVMEDAKEKENRMKEERIRYTGYTKGGVVEPITQKNELEKGEKILPLDELQICITAKVLGLSVEEVKAERERRKRKEERESTNNWRKIHGLPMRRKARKRLEQ